MVMMREPKAAVPRWKMVVAQRAWVTGCLRRRLSHVQNQREKAEASTRSEKAEQKERPQYRPNMFTAWGQGRGVKDDKDMTMESWEGKDRCRRRIT